MPEDIKPDVETQIIEPEVAEPLKLPRVVETVVEEQIETSFEAPVEVQEVEHTHFELLPPSPLTSTTSIDTAPSTEHVAQLALDIM